MNDTRHANGTEGTMDMTERMAGFDAEAAIADWTERAARAKARADAGKGQPASFHAANARGYEQVGDVENAAAAYRMAKAAL